MGDVGKIPALPGKSSTPQPMKCLRSNKTSIPKNTAALSSNMLQTYFAGVLVDAFFIRGLKICSRIINMEFIHGRQKKAIHRMNVSVSNHKGGDTKYFLSSPEHTKLRVVRGDQDFPCSSTGSFVVQHYVHGVYSFFSVTEFVFVERFTLLLRYFKNRFEDESF